MSGGFFCNMCSFSFQENDFYDKNTYCFNVLCPFVYYAYSISYV